MIHFRKACYEDIDRIIEVQNRSFYEDYERYGECPAYNESREAIKKQIDEGKVYVIEYDGEIIGDIIVRVRSEGCYYLRVLSIVPEYHNKGIGQKAIQFMENENPEAKLWHLITPYKSFRNHHFYEKMGYVKVSEYKHSDCLTMFEYKKTITE